MVIDFLHPFNFVFYLPLTVLSVVSVSVIAERLHDLIQRPLLSAREYQAVHAALRRKDLQPVAELIQAGKHLEIHLVKEFLQLRKAGAINLLAQLELLARELVQNRESRLDLLAAISGIATMFGLLGTVTGMIWSFQAMSAAGRPDPAVLSGGIAQALITTAFGLLVAIPSLSVSNILKLRVKKLANRLEFLYEELSSLQPLRQG